MNKNPEVERNRVNETIRIAIGSANLNGTSEIYELQFTRQLLEKFGSDELYVNLPQDRGRIIALKVTKELENLTNKYQQSQQHNVVEKDSFSIKVGWETIDETTVRLSEGGKSVLEEFVKYKQNPQSFIPPSKGLNHYHNNL